MNNEFSEYQLKKLEKVLMTSLCFLKPNLTIRVLPAAKVRPHRGSALGQSTLCRPWPRPTNSAPTFPCGRLVRSETVELFILDGSRFQEFIKYSNILIGQ